MTITLFLVVLVSFVVASDSVSESNFPSSSRDESSSHNPGVAGTFPRPMPWSLLAAVAVALLALLLQLSSLPSLSSSTSPTILALLALCLGADLKFPLPPALLWPILRRESSSLTSNRSLSCSHPPKLTPSLSISYSVSLSLHRSFVYTKKLYVGYATRVLLPLYIDRRPRPIRTCVFTVRSN